MFSFHVMSAAGLAFVSSSFAVARSQVKLNKRIETGIFG
jgi:hypothetical protein